MAKQTLSIEQMQHLQELGLEMKETMLYWCRIHDSRPRAATNNGKWTLCKGKNQPCVAIQHWGYIPAYTLQDVLDILPTDIKPAERRFWLRIDLSDECLYYYYDDCNLVEHRKKVIGYDGIDGLIDAAYSLLCWCIENGYLDINKNE